jgi:hypothetical protein
LNGASRLNRGFHWSDQPVLQSLMVPFAMVVRNKLRDGIPQ